MVDLQGLPLTTISHDKVEWYVSRKLASVIDWPDKRFTTVIQLNFANKQGGMKECDLIPVDNICVVCGATEQLQLHHVVPHRIKRFYAENDKNWTRDQCVLLCHEHHQKADLLTKAVKDPHHLFTDWMSRLTKAINRILSLLRYPFIKYWLWRQGGVAALNRRYIDAFLKLEPKHLPKGWLK